jgi:hypothetical protein
MVVRVLRVLIGFALASLAATVTLVLFAHDLGTSELRSKAAVLALFSTPHVAVYAALPALVGAVFAEVRKVARWSFYALAGIVTAAAGFLLQHLSEAPGEESILSNYGLVAFLTSGLVGGLAYWASSGRFAARRPAAAPDANPQPN